MGGMKMGWVRRGASLCHYQPGPDPYEKMGMCGWRTATVQFKHRGV